MRNTYIIDTILHWLEDAVSGSSNAGRDPAFVINIPVAFLVPSSSGMRPWSCRSSPLSDFAGVSRSVTVTAFQSASGFMNYADRSRRDGWAALAVGYNRYVRFLAPILGIMFVLICVRRCERGD
jgi:uncharacterized ion transporter superfamily protein YfcC